MKFIVRDIFILFYVFWTLTLTLKISSKSPEPSILCSFQTHCYLFPLYPMPWQADLNRFHQWAPRRSGFLFGSPGGGGWRSEGRGREKLGYLSPATLSTGWGVTGTVFYRRSPLLLRDLLTASCRHGHSFSSSSLSIPGTSLPCSFWLRVVKFSVFTNAFSLLVLYHPVYST